MSFPSRVSTLNRKLVRDLWAMKGQGLAIAAVVAAGVTMFVTYLSTFDSLQRTRVEYFERHRMADVFASVARAPMSLRTRIAAMPGVEVAATRVVADVTLDVPGLNEPASGRLVSIPERGRPELNDLYLRRGRWIEPGRPDEVVASEVFCEANGFVPGDRLAAIINGRRRTLTIVGVALSPEYVYAVRPGELIPDRRRYGVLWMGRESLASAFDMEGGFNDLALRLVRGQAPDGVIATLDALLEPYGGLGAYPQRMQVSAWTLDNELNQLQMFGLLTPLIFLGVAAFVLHVALSRALALQRPEIAALKALGYTNRAIGWHYTKWALVIAGLGAVSGVGAGWRLGTGMIGLYNAYFRFPDLTFTLSPPVVIGSLAGSLVVAALGAQGAVRRAVRVPAAEAMRPDAPARYRRSVLERTGAQRFLSLTTRIIVRNLERQPLRAALSVLGIALAAAVLVVGLAFTDIMNALVEDQFGALMRQDATVTFATTRAARAAYAVAHLPGVMDVEPLRMIPARLRSAHRSYTLAITAVPPSPQLSRVVDRRGRVVPVGEDGLVLSAMLATRLHVRPGDSVRVEVLEGARPAFDVRLVRVADDTLGMQAYVHAALARRLLRQGTRLSGAHVTLDSSRVAEFYQRVKAMPAVAGVALREVTLRNFREAMAESMSLSVAFNVAFAAIIAFGVVYNAARVSLSERARELASLRVLGFTRREISLVLLGELALLTVVALPVGLAIGLGLGRLIMLGFNNEVYRLTFVVAPATVAWAFMAVVASAAVSGLVVRRRLDTLDLVAVLKARE